MRLEYRLHDVLLNNTLSSEKTLSTGIHNFLLFMSVPCIHNVHTIFYIYI